MNYMPDMAHFAFPRAAAGRITISSLCAHFERVLPYTRLIQRYKKKPEVWVDGHANGASVELLPINKQQRQGLVKANRTFEPADHIIRLCSGPNHDYTYLPIYYDVELALLQVEGICRIYAEGELRPLDRMTEHFEWVAGRMTELSAEEDYSMIRTDIASAMRRLTEALPIITTSPALGPWLLQGLLDVEDARADGILAQLREIRSPEVLRRLEEMLGDPENEYTLDRLFDLYLALTAPGEGAPTRPAAPDREAPAHSPADEDDEPWERWLTRYVLACHDEPGPLLAALSDPSEAQALFEQADMSFFITRTQDLPNFGPLLDDYIDQRKDGNLRFEELITAIAALLRERGQAWVMGRRARPAQALDPASAELWASASESIAEDIRPHVRTIAALLGGDAAEA